MGFGSFKSNSWLANSRMELTNWLTVGREAYGAVRWNVKSSEF